MSAETALRQIGVDLRRRIWDPLASHIVGVDRVFIVPDGPLSLVSFAALPTGPARYLIEDGPTIHYLSAERDLTVHRDSSAAGLLALGGASFGDPSLFSALATGRRSAPASLNEPPKQAASGPAAYRSATSRCATFQALTFGELPASAQEVASIAALWEKFVPAAPASGQNPSVLVGAAADERSFKVRGPGSRVLHLATHGFFLGTDCTATLDDSRSVGGLVPRSRPKVLKQNPNALRPSQPLRSISENPLLLSGLALAGANRRTSATGDEEDGILTAEEVASMNLARRRVGRTVGLRHRARRDPRRRRGPRPPPRLPDRRSAYRHHEPLGGRRSFCHRLDARPVRRQARSQTRHRGRRTRGKPHRPSSASRQGPEHSPLLLGWLRRLRRLAVDPRHPSDPRRSASKSTPIRARACVPPPPSLS